MERTKLATLVGVAMVVLGLAQAGLGVVQDEPIYAGLGVAYAAIGVAYIWAEGYAANQ